MCDLLYWYDGSYSHIYQSRAQTCELLTSQFNKNNVGDLFRMYQGIFMGEEKIYSKGHVCFEENSLFRSLFLNTVITKKNSN